jgi:Cytochrome c oxidase caa3 assembly factor (Caa3_CtaG)
VETCQRTEKILARRRRLLSWLSFTRYIRRVRHRHATLPELQHWEKAGRISPRGVAQVAHDNCNPIRVGAMVHLLPSCACPVPRRMRLPARLVAFTKHESKPDFALAACHFHDWYVCAVDCLGFAAANASPRTALCCVRIGHALQCVARIRVRLLFRNWASLLVAGYPALAERDAVATVVHCFISFFATFPCDILSAFLTFCDRVVYPCYLPGNRHFGISPLQDQEYAGALMWVCVTFIYLLPAVVITTQLLSSPRSHNSNRLSCSQVRPTF